MKRFAGRDILWMMIALMLIAASSAVAVTDKASPVPEPEKKMKAGVSLDDASLSGKVVETMNAGGYTYVSLEKAGKKTWVAIPTTEVKVGQEMTLQPGAEMKNFTSPSLKRTFDSIIFSGGPATKSGSAGGAKPAGAQNGGKTAAAPKLTEKIKVEKASGSDAYTVGELHEKIAALHEKKARVKAKVVKISKGIMGKNWIHLQDGTGDAAKGTDRLTATSQDLPAVGDIVTMKGTMYKDKDFGSGYKYAVIMEKAAVVK